MSCLNEFELDATGSVESSEKRYVTRGTAPTPSISSETSMQPLSVTSAIGLEQPTQTISTKNGAQQLISTIQCQKSPFIYQNRLQDQIGQIKIIFNWLLKTIYAIGKNRRKNAISTCEAGNIGPQDDRNSVLQFPIHLSSFVQHGRRLYIALKA
uniref:Uncharacterized protein n=1 Tax=Glossina palpalis gambiensis TaxID=67801 RepID=A0A1B0C2X5_9MUSC